MKLWLLRDEEIQELLKETLAKTTAKNNGLKACLKELLEYRRIFGTLGCSWLELDE